MRNNIYSESLTATSGSTIVKCSESGDDLYTKLVRRIQTQVLRVNKQIYAEARPMLLKSNGVIHSWTDDDTVVKLLIRLEVPIQVAQAVPDELKLLKINFLKSEDDPDHAHLIHFIPDDHVAVVRIIGDIYLENIGYPWTRPKRRFWLEVVGWRTYRSNNALSRFDRS